jgi:hypothetical protein
VLNAAANVGRTAPASALSAASGLTIPSSG